MALLDGARDSLLATALAVVASAGAQLCLLPATAPLLGGGGAWPRQSDPPGFVYLSVKKSVDAPPSEKSKRSDKYRTYSNVVVLSVCLATLNENRNN